MRLTSEFWVSAYIRRCHLENLYAVVQRRGSPGAGAIWVVIDDLGGHIRLFGPAPFDANRSEDDGERSFVELLIPQEPGALAKRLAAEQRFDSDMWVVDVESRNGEHLLQVQKNCG
jgi:hypothetical protein